MNCASRMQSHSWKCALSQLNLELCAHCLLLDVEETSDYKTLWFPFNQNIIRQTPYGCLSLLHLKLWWFLELVSILQCRGLSFVFLNQHPGNLMQKQCLRLYLWSTLSCLSRQKCCDWQFYFSFIDCLRQFYRALFQETEFSHGSAQTRNVFLSAKYTCLSLFLPT